MKLDDSIYELTELPIRLLHILDTCGFVTVKDLLMTSPEDFLKFDNLNKKYLGMVQTALRKRVND